jgi:hypothetical protein
MLAHTLRIAVAAAFGVVLCAQAKANGPPAAPAPVQGMLVLRNGEVIKGQITKVDDLYLVDLTNGRIRIKQADVELICGSLEEGYRQKRATIQVGNVHDHLSLAQWCLRHNLLGPASVELADAATADPKHPMVAVLQHRLKMAMEPPPAFQAKKGPATTGPSNEELDRMMRGLPRGSAESFTRSVQPVLLNHCATSGCHGSESASLRLLRGSGGASMSRRTTQRNLYSALKYIDLANPSGSRLLSAASQPHGTIPHAIFTERQAVQYQRLVDWANQVGGHPTLESAAAAARSGPADVTEPTFGARPPRMLPQESRNAQALEMARRRGVGHRPAASSKKADETAPASYDQPADPHDPEVFNRLYGRDKGKQETPPKSP